MSQLHLLPLSGPANDLAGLAPPGSPGQQPGLGGQSAPMTWPHLCALEMDSAALDERSAGIGGSDANTILSGDAERITRLWREKRGEADPEDLSKILPVMLGSWTEAFNRQWYERESGLQVSRVGTVEICKDHEWRRCTLDGYVEAKGSVFEAKHVGAFRKPEEVVEAYMPQLQHNMAVLNTDRALLSVIFGNQKWEVYEIAYDWLYQEELLIAETRFWDCVKSGDRPIPAPVPPAPKPVGVREMCLEGNNSWAAAASDWLECREAAKRHTAAVSALKSMIESDVTRAFGHGVEIRRSKAGALSIKELAA